MMVNDAGVAHEQIQFEGLIQGLINQQYGCCDDFLSPDIVAGLRDTIHRLSESGEMQSAGTGKKKDYQKNTQVRGDRIKWIEKDGDDSFEVTYLKKLGSFIQYLNATCYTAINGFESHYASYEKNSFYKRHLDQFKHDEGRKFSVVVYLNEHWQGEDGGMLSLYPKGEKQIDLSPLSGRMVFFKSDEMEHEVHPSLTRDRISIAGWMKSEG